MALLRLPWPVVERFDCGLVTFVEALWRRFGHDDDRPVEDPAEQLADREAEQDAWEPHVATDDCCTFHQPTAFDIEAEECEHPTLHMNPVTGVMVCNKCDRGVEREDLYDDEPGILNSPRGWLHVVGGLENGDARRCPCGSDTCGVCREATPQLPLSDSELFAVRNLMTAADGANFNLIRHADVVAPLPTGVTPPTAWSPSHPVQTVYRKPGFMYGTPIPASLCATEGKPCDPICGECRADSPAGVSTEAPPLPVPPAGTQTSPAADEGIPSVGADLAGNRATRAVAAGDSFRYQKSEGCWCGEHIEVEGTEEAVLRACNTFRWWHAHRDTSAPLRVAAESRVADRLQAAGFPERKAKKK